MRVALYFSLVTALTIGAFAPASAQEASEASNQETAKAAIKIPANQMRYYCFSGPYAYTIGAVTCLARGQRGTCKWTDHGSNHSAPPNRAYWIASVAPAGACP